ncbi:MAG TPA: PKD domain-containing protein, partial [Thermomicrobiales bacterium]|nr:PKD domain-containing protein [Thermomicrobiales bacterium]
QQNVVDWLAAASKRQSVLAADYAGVEYAKWAGLDVTGFENLLATNPSKDAVSAYLGSNVNNPTGYCGYRSPAPHESDYTGYLDQTCFTPCTNVLGCPAPTPTYDQLVKWGAAIANYEFYNRPEFQQASRDIAIGVGFGVGALVTGLALSGGLIGFVGSSTTWLALFPFSLAGSLAASIAGAVLFVVVAIVIAVIATINLFNALALPDQLATLISETRAATPDLAAMLDDPEQAKGLYSLFVGATLPKPRLATCDNAIGGGGFVPCLNRTPIPDANNTDPVFAIQESGTTATTHSNTITWKDTVEQTTRTARVSNTWFIGSESGSSAGTQSLRIHYTDWNGVGQTAWLLRDPIAGYQFLGVADATASSSAMNPDTCIEDGSCSVGSTIKFIGADDKQYSASLILAAPTVAPTTSADPVVGIPVTLSAIGASPLGLPVTYQWQFEVPGSFCIVSPTCPDGTVYGGDVSGAEVSHTWESSGANKVKLTATDSLGRVTIHTFTVTVASAGAPVLALSSTDVRTGGADQPISLTGVVTHLGATDSVEVAVDWGDGSPSNFARQGSFPSTDICACISLVSVAGSDPHQYALSATHRYQQPGTYTVTVRVQDPGGQDTEQAIYVIQNQPVIEWPTPDPITYGTPLSAAQLNASVSAPGAIEITGTFKYWYSYPAFPATIGDVPGVRDAPMMVEFFPDDSSYSIPTPVFAQVVVTPADLTITAPSASVRAGATSVPDLTAVAYDGFVNSEGPDVLGGSLTCSLTDDEGNSVTLAPELPRGSYTISCRGLTSSNYEITFVDGTLTVVDSSAPIITPSVVGELGSNGWYTSDVNITWAVSDPESGVTTSTGCEPTLVTEDTTGTSYTCQADSEGGRQTWTVTIHRDVTNPIVSFTGNQGTYGILDTVTITCTATDATSGIATDTCTDVAGAAMFFTPGQHTVAAVATDLAGHTATGETTFVVTATHSDLATLTTQKITHRATARLAAGLLQTAERLADLGLNIQSRAVLITYRAAVNVAQRFGYVSSNDATMLINWSRTL